MRPTADDLERARRALADHAWSTAFEILVRADSEGPLSPPDLDGLADAAWWMGRLDVAIDARQRAFAAHRKAGDLTAAAGAALDLCRDYGMRGNAAMHTGWLRRAERLLAGQPESPEHGLLEQRRASEAIHAGRFDAALAHATECEAIGVRLGDATLQALGLHLQGVAHIELGEVDEGLPLLDEAIVGALSGELEPLATGVIYCNAIGVCRNLADYGRAGEWTDAAKRWCERMSVSGFPGICRVQRAEITRLRGAWHEAEREARRAVEELRGFYVEVAGQGLYEIGLIRLRLGDLGAAEEAFREANELGVSPQPGLALLRLEEGNVDAAAAALRRALAEEGDRLRRARLLPAAVQIAIEARDMATAREACDELDAITETYTAAMLRAEAATAQGRLLLAEGDPEGAAGVLGGARRLWAEADAPYEAAVSRALLGMAYRATGDEDSATMELEGARATFESVGAALDLARIVRLTGASPRRTGASTASRAFMFTDMVASTPLVEAIGDEGWSDLVRWHDQTLRECFAEHGGEEVDHAGDGFFVAFPDGGPAIDCAVAIQRRLAEHRRSHGFSPRVRIGLHAARASRDGRAYRGKGVHTAARIGGAAQGEEILASMETVPARIPYPVSAPRSATLKGVTRPIDVVSIDWRP